MKKDRTFSIPIMAFTFFYAVVIYLLFIGFHYWSWHADDKEANK